MSTKKFIKNGIHYIKKTHDNGNTNTYPDPDFQPDFPEPSKPLLPDLSTTTKLLNFIIDELHLKNRFQ
ncbi:hypothetical protein ES707_19094 [subsurface metagenome]